MLEATLKGHPILGQLKNILGKDAAETALNARTLYGIEAEKLTKGENFYRIDESFFVQLFYRACQRNDIDCIRTLLNSEAEFEKLTKLKPTDPFYLAENPFAKIEVIIRGMDKASLANLDKPANAVWLFLSKKYQKQIETVLSTRDMFDELRASVLLTLAPHLPDVACIYLDQDFRKFDPNKLSDEQFSSTSYSYILYALFEVAVQPGKFKFAAKILLILAAREVKLGIYHGNYQALPQFVKLFQNACTKTTVDLKTRKECLHEFVQAAEKSSDYYLLFVLMRTFGVAANVFESGEDNYTPDANFEDYIHFAIENLLHHAGGNDENGLDATAEEELHKLLEATIEEPTIWGATDVPFRILRFYIQSKKAWNRDPFFHLNSLYIFIEDCKKDKDPGISTEGLHAMELRYEQLVSLVCHREFIAEDFILYRGAKNPKKVCEIGLEREETTATELHERQSLAERLIFVGKSSLEDIGRGYPKATYVIANFGLAVTDRPHKKEGDHRRVFRTIPLQIPKQTITGRDQNNRGHAEEGLYEYLLKDENIALLVARFIKEFGLNGKGHKVYAVVLDLHGTYDMCMSCSEKGLDFQNKFREKFLKVLNEFGMVGLTHCPSQLPIIIRYSSDLKYHYPYSEDNNKRGVLMATKQATGEKRDLGKSDAQGTHYDLKRDINHYGANLLIHGKENWHLLWDTKKMLYKGKKLSLESWTAFTTDYEHSRLSTAAKKQPYQQNGSVNTGQGEKEDVDGKKVHLAKSK
jgi:hypothetical protein